VTVLVPCGVQIQELLLRETVTLAENCVADDPEDDDQGREKRGEERYVPTTAAITLRSVINQ
jgi:hypothetical protein